MINTQVFGTGYAQNGKIKPIVFVDADRAGNTSNGESLSGMTTLMGGAAASWYFWNQEAVVFSTIEAEYISVCFGTNTTVWTRRLISGTRLVPVVENATFFLAKNQGNMELPENEAVSCCTKQTDVLYQYTKNVVAENVENLKYCCSDDMVADILTKPLGRIKLEHVPKIYGLPHRDEKRRKHATMWRFGTGPVLAFQKYQ